MIDRGRVFMIITSIDVCLSFILFCVHNIGESSPTTTSKLYV